RLRLHLKTFFGSAAEDFEEQLLHGAEVVVHQLRFEPRLARETARRDRGVPLFEHQLLGRVEQQAAILRVRRPDPAGRCHAFTPLSRGTPDVPTSTTPDSSQFISARVVDLDPDITAMLSRCSALHGFRTWRRWVSPQNPIRPQPALEARRTCVTTIRSTSSPI